GRLATDERDARLTADLRGAFDELRHVAELDLRCGDVVEEDERLGAACDHIIDAVCREVGAACPEGAALPREDELRSDPVGRSCEKAAVPERMKRCELTESRRAGRFDGGAKPVYDSVRRRERNAGGIVRRLSIPHRTTLSPAPDGVRGHA